MKKPGKCLVVGGAGYVGSHVCKLLRAKNIPHLVYDDFSTGHTEHLAQTPYVKGDIADAMAVQRCMSEFRPDTVIHLAALATVPSCTADPERARLVNIEGTRNILDAMLTHGAKRMVFASSCAVYAPSASPKPFTEADNLRPDSLYGQTKLECEHVLARYFSEHDIGYVALRIFNVAGADTDGEIGEHHEPETHLIPLAIHAACTGATLPLFGNDYSTADGTAIRDYVHVCDIAESMLRGAEKLAEKPQAAVLNIGSGTPTSVLQIIRAVEAATGKTVRYEASPRRTGDAPYLLGDITRLKNTLGYTPQYSDLTTVVDSAYAWYRQGKTA